MIRDYKHVQNFSKPHSPIRGPHTYSKGLLRNIPEFLKSMRSLDRKVLLVSTVLVIAAIVFITFFKPHSVRITVVEFGRIADQFDSKGLFVKSEQVFYAPYAGKVTIFAEDGQRVPSGKTIAELVGSEGKKTYFARNSGIVSFEVDGLETTLRPVMLENFQQNYRDFRGKGIMIANGEKVNAGRPLFKIVDNFVLYMLVEAPAEVMSRYEVGDKIWITSGEQITIVGWIKEIIEHRRLFVVKMERFPDEILNMRWANVTVMTDAHNGVIIPESALVTKDEKLGVYMIDEGNLIFSKITEIGRAGDQVAVEGISRGVEVLVNPTEDLDKFKQTKQK